MTRTPENRCSPSWRANVTLNGLNPPAWLFAVPAVNAGPKPWSQPEPIVKALEGSAGGLPLHGVSCEVVVYVPQADGVTSDALGPPKSFNFNSLKGSWG